jgi:glucosamine--fructose-6-phosphate aminotransferase (isomerizing)
MMALVGDLRARQASVLVVGSAPGADISLPAAVPEALSPIVAVVRGQQLARELALCLGRNPDSPAGLTKVTLT